LPLATSSIRAACRTVTCGRSVDCAAPGNTHNPTTIANINVFICNENIANLNISQQEVDPDHTEKASMPTSMSLTQLMNKLEQNEPHEF
jgi:hypothetical protein